MAEDDRPLPTPPRTRFGRQIRGEEEGAGPLTADRLTQAAAEGQSSLTLLIRESRV